MKELIKITTNEKGQRLVSARELYKGLGLARTKWTPWYKKNIIENDFFKESIDWVEVSLEVTGGKTTDFAISLEFGKHLAMMARTEKSHEYRNYFIECEKQLSEIGKEQMLQLAVINAKSEEETMLALKNFNNFKNEQINKLETEVENERLERKKDKPFVDIAKERLAKGDNLTITDCTRGLGLKRGQITNWAKDRGYLHKSITEVNEAGREYFKIYVTGKYKSIAITEKGVELINDNLEEIKNYSQKRLTK